jgi:flagellar assembly protein FliH
MMISPFENAEAATVAGLSVRLVSPEARVVSRLEFYAIDEPEIATTAEPDETSAGTEVQLKEEVAQLDGRLQQQADAISTQIEMARNETQAKADLEWELRLEGRLSGERASVLRISNEFGRERARYFATVEVEVVKLALAIAARILHREVKLDPLLLAGVVRVALEKIAEGSTTVLHVPSSDLKMWQDVFATAQDTSLQLVGDERLAAGECLLDTNVGRVELGVSAQLQEIERGFFDLLQQRPA